MAASEATGAGAGQGENPKDKALAWLVGGFSLVTALLTTLSGTSGSLVDRLQRSHPLILFFCFAGLILAIALALMSYLLDNWVKDLMRWLGLVLFFVALLSLVLIATIQPIAPERATVRAAVTQGSGLTLEASAKASGLRSGQDVVVEVYGLVLTGRDEDGQAVYTPELFYKSRTGPDRGGNVDLGFQVPIPSGRYNTLGIAASVDEDPGPCDFSVIRGLAEELEQKGCVLLRLPPLARRPDVSATLSDVSGTRMLSAEVNGQGLRAEEHVVVRVLGFSWKPDRVITLYRASLGPNDDGTVTGKLEVPLPRHLATVCVEATARVAIPPATNETPDSSPLPHRCPRRKSPLTGWARVPIR